MHIYIWIYIEYKYKWIKQNQTIPTHVHVVMQCIKKYWTVTWSPHWPPEKDLSQPEPGRFLLASRTECHFHLRHSRPQPLSLLANVGHPMIRRGIRNWEHPKQNLEILTMKTPSIECRLYSLNHLEPFISVRHGQWWNWLPTLWLYHNSPVVMSMIHCLAPHGTLLYLEPHTHKSNHWEACSFKQLSWKLLAHQTHTIKSYYLIHSKKGIAMYQIELSINSYQ